jgi:hypothetical protein
MQVKKIHVPKRENPIVNRLNKTKVEKFPNLQEEKLARQREISKRNQEAVKARVSAFLEIFFPVLLWFLTYAQKKEEARIAKERKEAKHQKDHAYDDLFTEEAMEQSSNQNRSEDFLDDFM